MLKLTITLVVISILASISGFLAIRLQSYFMFIICSALAAVSVVMNVITASVGSFPQYDCPLAILFAIFSILAFFGARERKKLVVVSIQQGRRTIFILADPSEVLA